MLNPNVVRTTPSLARVLAVCLSGTVAAAAIGCTSLLGDYAVGGFVVGGDAGADATTPPGPTDAGADADAFVDPNVPALVLTLATPRVALVRGTSATIGVTIERRGGYADAVVVNVSGLPRGVTVDNLSLGSAKTTGSLTFHATVAAALDPHSAITVTAAGGTLSQTSPLVLRVQDAAGTLDTTFGTQGIAAAVMGSSTSGLGGGGLAVDDDGRIVICGNGLSVTGTRVAQVARMTTDGKLDTTFATAGVFMGNSPGHTLDVCNGVVVLPGGALALAGFTLLPIAGSPHAPIAAKLTNKGVLDTTFGGGTGFVTITVSPSDAKAHGLLAQSDGKLVLGGFGNNGITLWRLLASGSLDVAFGDSATGQVTSTFTNAGGFVGFGFHGDGRIYASPAFATSFLAFRYTALGALDPSFGSAGHAVGGTASQVGDTGGQLVVQPDNKAVLVGSVGVGAADSATKGVQLARFTEDGKLDATFGTAGVVTTSAADGPQSARALALASDGTLVVAASIIGSMGTGAGVVRYTSHGALDATFADRGYTAAPNTAGTPIAQAITTDVDGRIIIAGTVTLAGRQSAFVARYWP